MFFFLQSCVLMQLLTGDSQDRTSWSYIFGCQLNLTYMGLPGSSLFPEGIGSIKWSGEFSNQLFDRWPKEMSDFYWFNFGILTIYGYMNIRVYIYFFFYLSHIYTTRIYKLFAYPFNMKCLAGKFVHQPLSTVWLRSKRPRQEKTMYQKVAKIVTRKGS